MALAKVIGFRDLNDELTDDEFFNQFIKSIGRDLIVKSLTTHFQHNSDVISPVTKIQSNIIESRVSQSNPSNYHSYSNIDQLPSEIIGKCASFLHHSQYFTLARCNRNLYISCYSPSQLRKIDLIQISSFSKIKCFKAFENVQELAIRIKDFNGLSPSDQATWSNNTILHTLHISNDTATTYDTKAFIRNQYLIPSKNIKSLHLSTFKSLLIYQILSRFSYIEQLSLSNIQDININSNAYKSYNNDEIAHWFPYLKKLDIKCAYMSQPNTADSFCGHIIAALSNQLQALTIENMFNRYISLPSNMSFPKLQSLILFGYPQRRDMLDTFSNVTTLERFIIHTSAINIFNGWIEFLIKKQLSLRYFQINTGDPDIETTESMMEQIEVCLAKYRHLNQRGDELEIVLNFDGPQERSDKMGIQIFGISNMLNMLKMNNWKLNIYIYDVYNTYNNDSLQHLRNELNHMKSEYSVNWQQFKDDDTDEVDIVISNKQ